MNGVKLMLMANIKKKDDYKNVTKETVICYIETTFIQVKQGTKQPEAGP